ncbi:MAG: insulinase family protein, partial [Clostridia bacterium]|nr:insulinase family protein [Clostridia bacterium]
MFSGKLSNGLRYVGEPMPGYRSVSMGVWVNAGSVFEQGTENGAAHFIEHMLCKGTKSRSASDIAEQMDAVGGNLNAFTSKECTCFYGRVLEKSLPTLSGILADMVTEPLFDEGDIEKEKGVVTEEILMTQDSPEDLVIDTAVSLFYEGDPLERPILGTEESVRSFTR